MSMLDTEYDAIKEMLAKGKVEPVQVEDITIGEIECLCMMATKFNVKIDVTVNPGNVEIDIEPWVASETESSYKMTPHVKVGTTKLHREVHSVEGAEQ